MALFCFVIYTVVLFAGTSFVSIAFRRLHLRLLLSIEQFSLDSHGQRRFKTFFDLCALTASGQTIFFLSALARREDLCISALSPSILSGLAHCRWFPQVGPPSLEFRIDFPLPLFMPCIRMHLPALGLLKIISR